MSDVKKTKVVVFGSNLVAELLKSYYDKDERYELLCYTLDDEYCTTDEFNGVKMIPFSKLDEYYPERDYEIIPALGYVKMNDVRKTVIEKLRAGGYKLGNYIHPSSVINSNSLGEGNIIFEGCLFSECTTVGSGNVFFSGTIISHHSTVGDYNWFAAGVVLAGAVKCGNNCFFGLNSTVRNKATVADYTLLGAGAYLYKDSEKYDVFVPARSLKLDKKSIEMNI